MKAWNLFAFFLAVAILGLLVAAVQSPAPWQEEGAGGAEDFGTLAEGIFSEHVLALEVLGVLLTAAMIGAMVLARPLGLPTDQEMHYSQRIDDEVLEQVQHVSDIRDDLDYAGTPTPYAPPQPPAGGEEE